MFQVAGAPQLRNRRLTSAFNPSSTIEVESLETRRMMAGYAIEQIPGFGGSHIETVGLTEAGLVAGFGRDGSNIFRGFLFDNDGRHDIGTLGGMTTVRAIGTHGHVVGTSVNADGIERAVLYAKGGTLLDLGALPGETSSSGTDVNGTGVAIGQSGAHGFVTVGGELVSLSQGGSSSIALEINDDGVVLGTGYTANDRLVAFIRKADGSFAQVGLTGNSNTAADLSETGFIVGSTTTADTTMAFRSFGGATAIPLGTLGGTYSMATAVAENGFVTGDSASAGDASVNAYLFNGTAMIDLGHLGGGFATGQFVNKAGVVAGRSVTVDGADLAFVHTGGDGTMVPVNFGGTLSQALDLNEAGQVVGTANLAGDLAAHAFLFTGGQVFDLNDLLPENSGWELTLASHINDDGVIVGQGFYNGVFSAFRMKLSDDVTPPTIGGVTTYVNNMFADGRIDRVRNKLLVSALERAQKFLDAGREQLAAVHLGVARLHVERFFRQGRISEGDYQTLAADLDALIQDLLN